MSDSFAQNLARIRKDRGLSQSALAEMVGVSYPRISEYERGVKSPLMTTVERIADALQCSLDELTGRTGE